MTYAILLKIEFVILLTETNLNLLKYTTFFKSLNVKVYLFYYFNTLISTSGKCLTPS